MYQNFGIMRKNFKTTMPQNFEVILRLKNKSKTIMYQNFETQLRQQCTIILRKN